MKINVTCPSMPEFSDYIKEISELWDTKYITNNGNKKKELERLLKEKTECEYISLFSNGHTALEYILQGFELEGEVITTPFTFASTTHAIVRSGLTPVFCDIDPYDFNIDPDKIEALITEKTSAILGVHVFGNVCNVEKIQKIADKYNLKVIYDGAHAFGTVKNGKSALLYGDATMVSFHATKVFNTIEGGAVISNDEKLIEKLNVMQNFGLTSNGDCEFVGGNGKMNEFEAAMGICNLKSIDDEIKKRKNIYELYLQYLNFEEGMKIPSAGDDVISNYAYFPVYFGGVKSASDVCRVLGQNEIYARRYFYPCTNEMTCYKDKYRGKTPVALEISQNILALPMYSSLKKEQVEHICDIINSI